VGAGRGRLTVHRLLRIGACAVAALALMQVVYLAAGADRAPSAVASMTPADGTVLAQAPAEVDLSFSAGVNPDLSHVDVRGGSGAAVVAGRPRLVRPNVLRQPVRSTAAGEVTVVYHVTLVDGTEPIGSLHFSVGASGATSSAGDGAGSAHAHGVDPVSAALLALDGLVALAVIALLARRPRPRRPAGRSARDEEAWCAGGSGRAGRGLGRGAGRASG
jgi:methionine-rich copper-binding protein CopC